MKRLVTGTMFGIFFSGCLPLGCSVNLLGTGEVGVKQTSTWSFFHRSEQEAVETQASAGIESPSLVDWVIGRDEVEDDGTTD